jgi:hypothetical protein
MLSSEQCVTRFSNVYFYLFLGVPARLTIIKNINGR